MTRGSLEMFSAVGGASFSQRLITEWENSGWQVTAHHVLNDQDYRGRRNSAGRWWMRWRMYALYGWTCWRCVRRSRAQAPLRVVTTNPFFAPALVQRAARSNGVTINLLYDLYPDALEQAGILRSDSWLARRCAAVTRYALRECAATVFLGEQLQRHAEARYGAARRAVIIPVGTDGIPFRSKPPQPATLGQTVTVLYAGQMGHMHDVETLRRVLGCDLPAGLRFMFHASGAGYAHLQDGLSASDRCQWSGSLPDANWQQVMTAAHVALVTMAHGAEDVVMPSKTYSALVAGQAILAICARESDLADLVSKHDCGWVVEPGDVDGLLAVLNLIVHDPLQLQRKRENAYKAGHEDYDMYTIARQWERLFESLSLS